MKDWKSLVKVCKRWRETIYASQHYLNLFFYLSNGSTAKQPIDTWPELPLAIDFWVPVGTGKNVDDFRAALALRDRIRWIRIFMTLLEANWFAELMEEEFPQLTHLDLLAVPKYFGDNVPYISLGEFLGGSVPALQHLCVDGFDYGGLPSLLQSTPNLVSLQIENIRPACYEPPEASSNPVWPLCALGGQYDDCG